jgi:hypothetical protein
VSKRNKAKSKVEVQVMGRDHIDRIDIITGDGERLDQVLKQWRERPEQQFLLMVQTEEGTGFVFCPSVPQLGLLLDRLSKEARGMIVVQCMGDQANAAYTSLPQHRPRLVERAPKGVALQ